MPTADNASRTSSSLNGFMMATMYFIEFPWVRHKVQAGSGIIKFRAKSPKWRQTRAFGRKKSSMNLVMPIY
jgi:hypothetical protein